MTIPNIKESVKNNNLIYITLTGLVVLAIVFFSTNNALFDDNPLNVVSLNVSDNLTVHGNLTVEGISIFEDEIVLRDDARVKKTLQISAGALKTPAVNAPTYVDHGLNGAWEFSKSAMQKVTLVVAVRPDMYIDDDPQIGIGWSSPSTSGDVVWQVELLWLGVNESTSNIIPDVTNTQIITVKNVSDGYSANFFTVDNPEETDRLAMIKISRLGDDVNDTADDVAHLIGVVVRYTSNKLGTPYNSTP